MKHYGKYEQRKPGKKKKNTLVKVLLVVFSLLLLLVVGGYFAASWYLDSMLDKVTIVTMPSAPQSATQPATLPPETLLATQATTQPTQQTTVETTRPPMKPEDIVNILVVGQAARAGEGAALADSMILLSLNTYDKTLTLTSFLRDTYVDLPDYAGRECGWNKLTTCYALGNSWAGTAGAMDMTNICLENNFGIEVDYNVEISFDSFIKVIDLMGGIGLELTQAEADYLNKDNYQGQTFTEGLCNLDGTDALSYARMRKAAGDSDSDIKRTGRQRYLVTEVVKKAIWMGLPAVNDVLNEVLPMIVTNMPKEVMKEYITTLLPLIPQVSIESGTCPVEKLYWAELKDTPDGSQYVLVFDKGQNTKIMRSITEAEPLETTPATEATEATKASEATKPTP